LPDTDGRDASPLLPWRVFAKLAAKEEADLFEIAQGPHWSHFISSAVLLALDRPEAGGCDVSAYQQHPGDHRRGIRFDCAGNRDVLGGGAMMHGAGRFKTRQDLQSSPRSRSIPSYD
jgi:hypothetical protein